MATNPISMGALSPGQSVVYSHYFYATGDTDRFFSFYCGVPASTSLTVTARLSSIPAGRNYDLHLWVPSNPAAQPSFGATTSGNADEC